MNFKPHSRIERTLGAGLALAITLAGLTILVHGFLPGNDEALVAKRQHLEAVFEREVKQAAVDAPPQTH
jgi:hypothetical protein